MSFAYRELAEALDGDFADGYEWYALDMDVRNIQPLSCRRSNCENIVGDMKNQWEWNDFTAHSPRQATHFAHGYLVAYAARRVSGRRRRDMRTATVAAMPNATM